MIQNHFILVQARLLPSQSSRSTVCKAFSTVSEHSAGRELNVPLLLAPTRVGRLLSTFFALRWRKTCSGFLTTSASHGPQDTFFYGRQFLHVKMINAKG